MVQEFSLDNYEGCTPDENGCFNKFPLRSKKCSKIKNFFNDNSSESVLKNWTDFQNECDNNRGCLGLYPRESDKCKNTINKKIWIKNIVILKYIKI